MQEAAKDLCPQSLTAPTPSVPIPETISLQPRSCPTSTRTTNMDRDLTTIAGPDVSRDISTSLQQSTQPQAPLRGSVLVLIQFDVCEEIRLDELRKIFPARKAEASFKKAPAYVRYQRTPVEETLEPLTLESGERLAGEIKYYDYGVVSLEFELPFSGSWETLVELSCRW